MRQLPRASPAAPHTTNPNCNQCHPKTLDASGAILVLNNTHINGTVELSSDSDSGSDASCTSCHGSDTNAAPPTDTMGRSDETLVTVGAHQSHLRQSSWHKQMECGDCHQVPENAADGHDDGSPAELTWGALASANNAPAQFDRTDGKCSGVYCHGATLETGGTLTTPVWTLTDSSQAKCGTCHSLPPRGDHPTSDTCSACHNTVDQDNNFVLPNKHIDGIVNGTGDDDAVGGSHGDGYEDPSEHGMDAKLQVADCRTCHGADLSGGTTGVNCDSCHAENWRTDCIFCHGAVVNAAGQIIGPNLHVNRAVDVQIQKLTFNGSRCTGTCHGENHSNEGW